MLSCTDFMDRLYDEDCRRALEARGPVPVDVAKHRVSCLECDQAWMEAEEDLRALPHLLLEPVPAALEPRIREQVRMQLAGRRPKPGLGWAPSAAWSSVVGAAAMLAAAQTLPPVLASLGPLVLAFIGASMAFAGRAVYEALDAV